MDNEYTLANSVEMRTGELIDLLYAVIDDRYSTDGVTFSLKINGVLKEGIQDIRNLIGDSGLDGRFKKRKGVASDV